MYFINENERRTGSLRAHLFVQVAGIPGNGLAKLHIVAGIGKDPKVVFQFFQDMFNERRLSGTDCSGQYEPRGRIRLEKTQQILL